MAGRPHRITMDPTELVDFAEELAAAARAETRSRWENGCPAEDKSGMHSAAQTERYFGTGTFDPVTEADRKAEQLMRDLIRQRFPDHGIIGEEYPDSPGTSAYSWSLDPIDGTRSFVCRLPTWVTLIACLRDGRPIVGLVDAPCLDETYVGTKDEAVMICRGSRTSIRASGCTRLADARLSTTDPYLFDEASTRAFAEVRSAVRTTRYGHDGYAYARLAAGSLDLVIESGLKPHDYNALIPVITAAGGAIGDWRGGEDFAAGQIVAAATRELYEEAVGLLSE